MDLEPEYLIVLYSKYSSQCQKILQLYDESIMSNIKLVCVDNSSTRKRLTMSSTFNIKTVPCILFMYPGNKVEKFEGPRVSNWLIEKMTSFLPSQPQQQSQPQIETLSPVRQRGRSPTPVPDPTNTSSFTNIEDISFVSEREIQEAKIQQKKDKTPKTLAERAAEMAAAREGADKPAHIQMQERQSKQIEASMNGTML